SHVADCTLGTFGNTGISARTRSRSATAPGCVIAAPLGPACAACGVVKPAASATAKDNGDARSGRRMLLISAPKSLQDRSLQYARATLAPAVGASNSRAAVPTSAPANSTTRSSATLPAATAGAVHDRTALGGAQVDR